MVYKTDSEEYCIQIKEFQHLTHVRGDKCEAFVVSSDIALALPVHKCSKA